MTSPLRVAYLVSQYPALSHAFIEREVHGLRARGVEVHTFSIRRCPDDELRSAQMRADAAQTTLVKDAPKAVVAAAHRRLLRRAPQTYARLLTQAATTGQHDPRATLWQLFYFAEAVVLHDAMSQRGLRHVHVHFPNVSADVARLTVALGRLLDGDDAGWGWSMTIHGSNEFENVAAYDLAAKVRSAAGISCITDFTRAQIMRQVEPAHWPRVDKVHMSVDPTVYAPPADGRVGRTGPLRLLFVGRLTPEKGVTLLVDALAQLRDRGIATTTRFVGGGDLEPALRDVIATQGLKDVVELVGPVGQDDLPAHYQWADVFVLPSFQEGLPVVIMEALATELPVVTSRISGIPELVVDGEMGVLVTAGRADLLADAIEVEAESAERRHEQGRAGRRAILAGYTTQATAAAMEGFLRRVVH